MDIESMVYTSQRWFLPCKLCKFWNPDGSCALTDFYTVENHFCTESLPKDGLKEEEINQEVNKLLMESLEMFQTKAIKLTDEEMEEIIKSINDTPAEIQTLQGLHGKWIKSDIPCEEYVCSVCGGAAWYYDYQGEVAKSRFCPNCGARMDLE